MRHGARRLALSAAAAACMAAPVAAEDAFGPLEPYRMVRSLQIVQDRLARGDHAALPMQKKLLELIDGRFASAGGADFDDPRNVTALLVYAMSGGNPKTVAAVVARAGFDGVQSALGAGLVAYMQGDLAGAARQLATIDPMTLLPEEGAFLALVQGSILSRDAPQAALRLFDRSRLLSPGTLVEEAALRRSLPLSLTVKDAERFLRASNQYTRRFLRSPYASQFADAFVDGLVEFHDQIDPREIDQILSYMTAAQREAVYLRLARRATIRGLTEMSSFASARLNEMAAEAQQSKDPRADLYHIISSVTSEDAKSMSERLSKVRARDLSERDRRLLRAAKMIAREMLSPPATPETEPEPGNEAAAEAEAAIPLPRVVEGAGDGVPVPTPQAKPAALVENAGASVEFASRRQSPASAADAPATDPVRELDPLLESTRARLKEIDALLEEATQ